MVVKNALIRLCDSHEQKDLSDILCNVPQYSSYLCNGFKLCLNEFKLRRHSIINQNTFLMFRIGLRNRKTKKNCKCHCLFVFKVKGLRREFIVFKTERTIRYLGNVYTPVRHRPF